MKKFGVKRLENNLPVLMFQISYHPKVPHDLERINKTEILRIRDRVDKKLSAKPQLYGIRLRGELREYWKLRVGDYRIVYKISNKNVFILAIKHRKEVYKMAEDRI
jgi:mRNA interferase RelE/StbE